MFIWFLIAIFIFRHHMRKNDKAQEKVSDSFWTKEKSSLVVRKKDLDESDYLQPSLNPDQLRPETYYDDIDASVLAKNQQYLRKLIAMKMVNFSHMSNTDIRLAYGTAMMTTIEAYEDNYSNYIRTLNTLGTELHIRGENDYAELFLKEAIHIGSDIQKTYLALGEILLQRNDLPALEALTEKARTLNSLTKDALVNHLEAMVSPKKIPVSSDDTGID